MPLWRAKQVAHSRLGLLREILSIPNEEFGRSDKLVRASFQSTFQRLVAQMQSSHDLSLSDLPNSSFGERQILISSFVEHEIGSGNGVFGKPLVYYRRSTFSCHFSTEGGRKVRLFGSPQR